MSKYLDKYSSLKAIAQSMFEQKNFTEAIKYYNNAADLIYSAIFLYCLGSI